MKITHPSLLHIIIKKRYSNKIKSTSDNYQIIPGNVIKIIHSTLLHIFTKKRCSNKIKSTSDNY